MTGPALRFTCAALLTLMAATGAHASASAPAARTVDVTIQNFAYSPDTITIDVGDTIRWTNLDSAPHSSVSVETGFVTMTLVQGQTTTTTFDRAGTFAYVCGVHGTSMKGTVVVRGTATDTPRPSSGVPGHIVDAAYEEARPDRLPAGGTGGALFLTGALLVALAAIVRFATLLRRP